MGNITLLETVLDAWFHADAAAVHGWMKSLPAGVARDDVLVEYVIVAGRRPGARFDEISAQVDLLPASWGRRVAVARLAGEWARHDPKAAAGWVLKLPVRVRTPGSEPKEEAAFSIGETDPETVLRPFASLEEPRPSEGTAWLEEARLSALGHIASSWADSDLEGARRWSETLPDAVERRRAMTIIGDVWAKVDCRSALDYARAHPEADWRDAWLGSVATTLVATDRAAAEAVARMASAAKRESVLSQVYSAWGESRPGEASLDVARAMAALEGEKAQEKYAASLWRVTRKWTAEDPRSAAAWAAGIERADIRDLAVANVGSTWAQSDPRAVLEWAGGLPADSRGLILVAAATSLASTDRELALRVLGAVKSGVGKTEALCAIGTSWARESPELALAWARSLPALSERDPAVISVLAGWAEKDADSARAQIGSLVDETLKPEALKMIEESRLQTERARLRKNLLGEKP